MASKRRDNRPANQQLGISRPNTAAGGTPAPKFTPLGYKNTKGEDNWRNYDPGKKFGTQDLKTLKQEGFTGNQQLKIAASVNPQSITGKANAQLFNTNKAPARSDFLMSGGGGLGPAQGGGQYIDAGSYLAASDKFRKDNNYKKGKDPGKLLKWQGIGQGLQVQKQNYTRGYSGTNQTPSGASEGVFGEWTPRTGWNNPFRTGKTKRIGGGQLKPPTAGGGGGGKKGGGKKGGEMGMEMPSFEGGGDDNSTSSSSGLSGVFGGAGTETFGAPTFRRRRSRAQRSGSYTQGPSRLGINLQRQSGLNIMRA